MHERNKQRRKWRRNKCDANYNLYKKLKNKAQTMVREIKQNYYLSIFSDKKNPSTIWKNLRRLGLVKSKTSDRSLVFTTNELNLFFLSDSLSNRVSDLGVVYLGDESYEDNKFYWRSIDYDDIRRAIREIKSCAAGMDGLSLDMVGHALPSITPQIAHLFNHCLLHGVFPSLWRSAIVCPILKGRCPTELKHYRLISILCALFKVLERLAGR